MDLQEWIKLYEPIIDGAGKIVSYDVVDDLEFIQQHDEENVWSEIWDFDSELPLLVPGCVLDENGGLQWIITKNPWSGDFSDLIVFLEGEDWN